jgi:hypothetical protein
MPDELNEWADHVMSICGSRYSKDEVIYDLKSTFNVELTIINYLDGNISSIEKRNRSVGNNHSICHNEVLSLNRDDPITISDSDDCSVLEADAAQEATDENRILLNNVQRYGSNSVMESGDLPRANYKAQCKPRDPPKACKSNRSKIISLSSSPLYSCTNEETNHTYYTTVSRQGVAITRSEVHVLLSDDDFLPQIRQFTARRKSSVHASAVISLIDSDEEVVVTKDNNVELYSRTIAEAFSSDSDFEVPVLPKRKQGKRSVGRPLVHAR